MFSSGNIFMNISMYEYLIAPAMLRQTKLSFSLLFYCIDHLSSRAIAKDYASKQWVLSFFLAICIRP